MGAAETIRAPIASPWMSSIFTVGPPWVGVHLMSWCVPACHASSPFGRTIVTVQSGEGTEQVVRLQGTPAPSQVKLQPVWVVIVHAPVVKLQQAPVGGGGTGQVVVLQGTPAPSQLKLQPVWVVIVHAPVVKLQQAPVGGGGTGQVVVLQRMPSPSQVKLQPAWVVIVHAPVSVLQQAPVTGGGGAVMKEKQVEYEP